MELGCTECAVAITGQSVMESITEFVCGNALHKVLRSAIQLIVSFSNKLEHGRQFQLWDTRVISPGRGLQGPGSVRLEHEPEPVNL